MNVDKLYKLAFEYKKTKLWRFVWEDEIFAVKFSDGEIGYCSIMGAAGEHCALGLYIGAEGFNSYRNMTAADLLETEFEYRERLLSQDCIQCIFDNKDNLSNEELKSVRKYAKENDISLRGRNAYPQFARYRPNRYPWFLNEEKEQQYLCDALAAAIELANYLESNEKSGLGLLSIRENTDLLPMAELKDGEYIWSNTPIPPYIAEEYPVPNVISDIMAARLKKAPRMGVWECGLIRLPEAVQYEKDEAPYFPVIMLAVENGTDYVLPVSPVADYEENPEGLVNAFAEAFIKNNICPSAVETADKRTFVLLEELCKRADIRLSIGDDLPAFYEAEESLWEHFTMSEDEEIETLLNMLNIILELDDDEIRNMPADVANQLSILAAEGILPPELTKRLNSVFNSNKSYASVSGPKTSPVTYLHAVPSGTSDPATSAKSYVISVSLGTGCYRHIKISAADTLFNLHAAIIDAFEFDDDHAHAFFMDNVMWSDYDAYFSGGLDGSENERLTHQFSLEQAGLEPGDKFKYVFDFGDEWQMQCKVLRMVEEVTAVPAVIRRKGESPEQY